MTTYVYDCEVFAHEWVVVFKKLNVGEEIVFINNNEGLTQFLEDEPLLVGFNCKHYDQYILKAILNGCSPEEVKQVNDYILNGGEEVWRHPLLAGGLFSIYQVDTKDDCQVNISLKMLEGHMGMAIEESSVDFNLQRRLTPVEIAETVKYCCHDVRATEQFYKRRKAYFDNKLTLGRKKDWLDTSTLKMTNARLTARYLGAVETKYKDARQYKFPKNLLTEYIPPKAIAFFKQIQDLSIPFEELKKQKCEFKLGDCEVTLGFGGIHGAIPQYIEEATDERVIRNQDVASYYPHLMVIEGYCSRSMRNPDEYKEMLAERMRAKKAGDMETANALKLVANTTYGCMLSPSNPLYDPLMGLSVCVTGQLRLLELATHLFVEVPELKIIQLNTDGLMVSFPVEHEAKYREICEEWQARTKFELEEDKIQKVVQKDVNNYIEVKTTGHRKVKGGILTRGESKAGAYSINNQLKVISNAIQVYFIDGTSVEDYYKTANEVLDYQLIAKVSSKYRDPVHLVGGKEIPINKCNRVYACRGTRYGTLYKTHAETGRVTKQAGLPAHCKIDNQNKLDILDIDKQWYMEQTYKYIEAFCGKDPRQRQQTLEEVRNG